MKAMDMTRISSSPWGFRFMSLAEFSAEMRKLGITRICTMFGDSAKLPLAIAPSQKGVSAAKRTASDAGVEIMETAISLTDCARQIPLAAQLGASYVRICEVWEDSPAEFEKVSENLRKAGRMAANCGRVLIVENHGGLMRTAESCGALLEKAGVENVKLNYDAANFLYYGEDPFKAWDALKDIVGFTHLKNIKWKGGRLSYCRIKDGLIDYSSLLGRFAKDGYKGILSLEYEEPADAVAGTKDDLASLENSIPIRR